MHEDFSFNLGYFVVKTIGRSGGGVILLETKFKTGETYRRNSSYSPVIRKHSVVEYHIRTLLRTLCLPGPVTLNIWVSMSKNSLTILNTILSFSNRAESEDSVSLSEFIKCFRIKSSLVSRSGQYLKLPYSISSFSSGSR